MTWQGLPPDEPRNEGDAYNGYILWHAQGSAKHGIEPCQFSVSVEDGRVPFAAMSAGVVWDVENIVTGWQCWPDSGQKDWRPNPAPHLPTPFPGVGFTEGFHIPIAVDANTVVMWDQATKGAWLGFHGASAIIAQQAPQNPGLYPVIAYTSPTLTSTGKNNTQVPNFQIIKWVTQPPCLTPQAQPVTAPPPGGYAPPPGAQPQPAAWGAPAQAPAPAPTPQPATPQQGGAWDPNSGTPPGAWN
jgi:hypothetical protein|tara:strand:+ start:248 stop:976 length:729 start_codon:yes stop_codon:yes gene_type:complete